MSADPIYAQGTMVPGTVYRVLRLLGEGGMGRVYEVSDTTVGRRYALKTLLGSVGRDREVLVRMALEARALARIEHPNIVNVITAGVTQDGAFYYVMERLNGRTLRDVIDARRRLELRVVLAVGVALASALERAHAEGVIHRDIKPDNVFLAMLTSRTSRVKLVDFGVAGFRERVRGLTEEEGFMVGTPRYASPEQQRGERASPRMDLWSLGMVLFEMLSGDTPFSHGSMSETIGDVQSPRPAPLLSDIEPGPPLRVTRLVASLLDKDPKRRPATASEVRRELIAIQAEGPSAALVSPAPRDASAAPRGADRASSRAEAPSAGEAASLAFPRTNRTLTAPGGDGQPLARGGARWGR